MVELFHFSHDADIRRFEPHVPATNPTQAPAVWAIDDAHAPLYWFPRDCPRVTAWPRNDVEAPVFRAAFGTTAHRVHAIELSWLPEMSTTTLFRYRFDPADFRPWPEANGQWISSTAVEPIEVAPVGDLLRRHVDAGIELRAVPSLWEIRELAISDRWDYSIVRIRNARTPARPA